MENTHGRHAKKAESKKNPRWIQHNFLQSLQGRFPSAANKSTILKNRIQFWWLQMIQEFLSLIDRMVEQIIPEPGAEEIG